MLTGDITAGPLPAQVLDLLTSPGNRVIWISGNTDRELLEYRRGQRETIPDPIAPWAAEQLREDHLDLLSSLPQSLSLLVNGLGKVLFCHATPRDDEEVVLVDSRLDRWRTSSTDSTPTSAPWSAATPTCRSSASPTADS